MLDDGGVGIRQLRDRDSIASSGEGDGGRSGEVGKANEEEGEGDRDE